MIIKDKYTLVTLTVCRLTSWNAYSLRSRTKSHVKTT